MLELEPRQSCAAVDPTNPIRTSVCLGTALQGCIRMRMVPSGLRHRAGGSPDALLSDRGRPFATEQYPGRYFISARSAASLANLPSVYMT